MNAQAHWIYDGSLSFEGGVDGGRVASLLPDNQLARASNISVRGGYPQPRPKEVHRATLSSPGMFQAANGYSAVDGRGHIFIAAGGKLHRIPLETFVPALVPMPDGGNNPNRRRGWFVQAEEFLIYQDGQRRPLIWDGLTLRRSKGSEVPTGTAMAYGIGRIWVANGKEYVGGDLVYSHADLGTASVLQFTENDYLNEGGAFSVPWQTGKITGLSFIARQDTATGDGSLMVLTRECMSEFAAPVDRDTWKNLQQPVQRFALLKAGATSQQSIVQVNGDLFFRGPDGVRSFYFAQREFQQWGNTPISREVEPIVGSDDLDLLEWTSAVNFDNRYLVTADPVMTADGVEHRRILSLDFDLAGGLRGKLPVAWEGDWFGDWRILQLVTCEHFGRERAFLVVREPIGDIALWELMTKDPIQPVLTWEFATKSYAFGSPKDRKRLETAYIWLEEVRGPVSLKVWYRSDQRTDWVPWASWSGGTTGCMSLVDCMPVTSKPTIASPIALPVPPPGIDPCVLQRDGYEFQLLLRLTGQAKLKKIVLAATPKLDAPYFSVTKDCTPLGSAIPCVKLPGTRGARATIGATSVITASASVRRAASATVAGTSHLTVGALVENATEDDTIHWPEQPPEPPPAPPGHHAELWSSYYGFGMSPGTDPNTALTPERIAHARCLIDSEIQGYGYQVAGGFWWGYQSWGTQGSFPSVDLKLGCDAWDGHDPTVGGSSSVHLHRWVYIPD